MQVNNILGDLDDKSPTKDVNGGIKLNSKDKKTVLLNLNDGEMDFDDEIKSLENEKDDAEEIVRT